MSRGFVLLLFAFALEAAARSGFVQTRDGRTFDGEIQFADNVILINSTNPVALTNLATMAFDTGASLFPGAPGKGNGLLGYYFDTTNFAGSVYVRLDETIDFAWGSGGPAPGVPQDLFSVIWTGEVEAPTNGNYTFYAAADDAGRLFVENKLVAESHGSGDVAESASEPIALEAGKRYPIKLLYFDVAGTARARLLWSGPGLPKSVIPKSCVHAKSFLPEHASDLLGSQGLLATYYKNTDLTGETLTRVDAEINFNWQDRDPVAGFSRSHFSVRWAGQLKADYSEDYNLYVQADEPVRVWIDNRLLIIPAAQFYVSEVRETIPLLAGEKYDIRVESQSTSASAVFKLMWSSASTPKAVIPPTHLFPSEPSATRGQSSGPGGKLPPGLLLRNGTFLAGTVEKASESSVQAGGLLKDRTFSAVNVARIHCQPLSPALVARVPSGRSGLLLMKGDFVDAEFRGIDGDEIKVNSVLFGLRSYSATKDVLAVILHDAGPASAPYECRLRDQSLLQIGELLLAKNGAVIRDPILGRVALPAGDLVQIKRR